MSDIQVKIGHSLLKNLVKLRQEKGDLSIEDVGGLFMDMASTFSPSSSEADQFMHQEIARLAKYIIDAKTEIFAISTNDKREQVIMNASQHLDEVIKSTELATTKIMDAADKIQGLANGIGGDRGKEIVSVTGEIYEACNFQDITGQRITKVIKLLTSIEERINKLNELFGGVQAPQTDAKAQPKPGQDLLNGPQLPGQGATQEEIDALLISLNPKN